MKNTPYCVCGHPVAVHRLGPYERVTGGCCDCEEARPCEHPGLKFTDGGMYLTCRTCPQRYVAVQEGFVIPDIMARGHGFSELDLRDDPYAVSKA